MNLNDKVMVPTDVANIALGPIPFVVPLFRRNGRYWAGDDVWRQKNSVLNSALKEHSKDAALQAVKKWGNTHYDVPVAVICFEDIVKAQRESGFMQGIEGVTTDNANVAVSASYVRKAVIADSFEKYFKVTPKVDVHYGFKDAKSRYPIASVQHVVLFPYNGIFIELNGDQFTAADAKAVNREKIPEGDLGVNQIIESGNVIYPHSAIFPEDIALSLIKRTCQFGDKIYGYDTNLGFYLPNQPGGKNAEMRALYAVTLDVRSRLFADCDLGVGSCRLVGVVENPAEGGTKK